MEQRDLSKQPLVRSPTPSARVGVEAAAVKTLATVVISTAAAAAATAVTSHHKRQSYHGEALDILLKIPRMVRIAYITSQPLVVPILHFQSLSLGYLLFAAHNHEPAWWIMLEHAQL